MQPRVAALLPSLLILLFAPAAHATAPFASVEGGFTVAFPSPPEVEHQTLDTPQGKVPYHLFSGELREGAFIVTYADYPSSGGLKPAERLKKTVDAQVAGQQGTRIYERPCSLGKIHGLEVRYRAANDEGAIFLTTLRNYLVGNRLYQVSVITLLGSGMTAEQIKALLDSFKLTGKR